MDTCVATRKHVPARSKLRRSLERPTVPRRTHRPARVQVSQPRSVVHLPAATVADSVYENSITNCYNITYMRSGPSGYLISYLFPDGIPIAHTGRLWTTRRIATFEPCAGGGDTTVSESNPEGRGGRARPGDRGTGGRSAGALGRVFRRSSGYRRRRRSRFGGRISTSLPVGEIRPLEQSSSLACRVGGTSFSAATKIYTAKPCKATFPNTDRWPRSSSRLEADR